MKLEKPLGNPSPYIARGIRRGPLPLLGDPDPSLQTDQLRLLYRTIANSAAAEDLFMHDYATGRGAFIDCHPYRVVTEQSDAIHSVATFWPVIGRHAAIRALLIIEGAPGDNPVDTFIVPAPNIAAATSIDGLQVLRDVSRAITTVVEKGQSWEMFRATPEEVKSIGVITRS